MQLNIFKEEPVRLPRKKLNLLFKKIVANEFKKNSKGVVNLIFTTDKQMKQLNRSFRKIDKSTDVLSFNIDAPDSEDALFGEIYISVALAIKQAINYNASLAEEIIRLSCHGMLHLIGYDHMKKNDEVIMKRKEEYYLSLI